MTTLLIADDEEAPREALATAIARLWPEAQIVAKAENGVDAWDSYLEHEPAVCFLDIRMPGLTGIDVARRIAATEHKAQVVFVTAFDDHALAAFEAGAVDYVMKPVDDARLSQAIARVKSRMVAPPADLQKLLGQLMTSGSLDALGGRRPAPPKFIQASVGKEVRMIAPEDVIFFEADSRYTRVVYGGTQPGEALIRTPLKELLAALDSDRFWQIHRSVIVNCHSIASAVRVDENTMHITLKSRSEKLPVSRQFQGLFKGQ
ncbi:LytR/AlgR family response regulator transcription factor [Piscinibacterium candidicorallinum]|jgi:DNA-binding LytR/AlgR family response regulator|uniref:LytR/AlgR family response regulator transcription factor n=1 Tax=Piscinibacterium candidicorallinum TaxID=1793872 RepID=A0ABV7H445_9BURK